MGILSCLYSSKLGRTSANLRTRVSGKSCKTLKKNLSEYQEFLDEDPQEYLQYMAQDGEWADHVIIQVCSEVLRRPILIVNSDPWNELVFVKPRTTDKIHGRAIILGHLNNEHYVSLTVKTPE